MKKILKKIDERIAAHKDLQKKADYEGSIAYQNIINGMNDIKEIILSEQPEQKEPCEICNGRKGKEIIYSPEYDLYPYKAKYCPNCGRPLTQSPTDADTHQS